MTGAAGVCHAHCGGHRPHTHHGVRLAAAPALANLPLPIIGAPLFIISHPKLVIEQCKAGVVGSMPALNARPASQLDEWLAEITETLAAYDRAHPDQPAAPFAINQIVHKSNDRLDHDMQICAKYKVPIVITSLGARTDDQPGGARLGRRGAARHHQQHPSRTRPSRRAPTA